MQCPEFMVVDHSGVFDACLVGTIFCNLIFAPVPPAADIFPQTGHPDCAQTVLFREVCGFYGEGGIHELQIIDYASLRTLEKIHAR